jgi:TadE-like protein
MSGDADRFRRFGPLTRGGRWLGDERGQAAIEFLLILPLFLALTFAIIELGKGFSYWVDMTHMAGEGGRYASVSWFPGCDPAPATGACGTQTLQTFIAGSADLSELANSSQSTQATGCPSSPSSTFKGEVPCKLQVTYCYPLNQGAGVTPGQPGSALRVNVLSTYRVSLVNASLGLIPGFTNIGDVHLQARSTIRLEQPVDVARLGVASISTCP